MKNFPPIVLDPEGRDIQGEITRIRERGPITRVELPGGVRAWSVIGAAELKEILSGDYVSKDPRQHWPAFRNGQISRDWPLLAWINTPSMFTAYGVDHRRLRKIIAPAFTHKRTTALEPRIRAITQGLIRSLESAPLEESVDIRGRFAYALPIEVINELLGVPEHLDGPLRDCVDAVFDTSAATDDATVSMIEVLSELVAYRSRNPGEDLTSALIVKVEEKKFTEKELLGTLYLTINAGHETTVNLLDQAIYLLLTHSGHRSAVLDGSLEWPAVIEEVLRYEAPAAHVPLRYAVKDFTLSGVAIAEGDAILAGYAGVGRDPRVHGAAADTFNPTRADKDHLAFGYGAHHCLGAPLARMEARIALSALFARYPNMELAVAPSELGATPGFVANGHRRLPVMLNG
ncbi:cytochrome P450 family protein [Nocardia rhamnosiphila]|uniref:Cytochrome P450 n=1 Tax=Nocardia rhamnosiphila TaxID=426716 RepID=A0ABV2WIW8_9NOCA